MHKYQINIKHMFHRCFTKKEPIFFNGGRKLQDIVVCPNNFYAHTNKLIYDLLIKIIHLPHKMRKTTPHAESSFMCEISL